MMKYIALTLAFTITFIGTWFVDFTRSDEITHKKKLTKFGRYALLFALTSAALAAYQTIQTDITLKKEKILQFGKDRCKKVHNVCWNSSQLINKAYRKINKGN